MSAWGEAKWTVNQITQKIGQSPNNMRSFQAYAMSDEKIGLKFLEPADSYDSAGNLLCAVGGVVIRMSTEGYPQKPSDGTLVIDNKNLGAYAANPLEIDGLEEDVTYYFSAFPYSSAGVFNQSADEANRKSAFPSNGETANVTVTVDDTSEFTGATITCVDETDGTLTQTATVTRTNLSCSFMVMLGHDYHIEFGSVDLYSTPTRTATRTATAGTVTPYSGSYAFVMEKVIVNVSANDGHDVKTVNITLNDLTAETSETKTASNGTAAFAVLQQHEYKITVQKVTHYATPKSDTYTAVAGNTRTVNLEYKHGYIYGFRVLPNESNPADKVEYIQGTNAEGKTPAHMDYATGEFDYGDWNDPDLFFMPRPCMLKSDGTVDYYLDPDDNDKKEDGTPSDVANTNYDGNAMMEWGKDGNQIWYKIVPDQTGTGAEVYISDIQQDEDYKAYSFYGHDGQLKEHFYTPIYNGVKIGNKLRSISNQSILNNDTGTNEISYATANGDGHYIETIADRILIILLHVLISKSTNSQVAFGNGHYNGGSAASSLLKTGTMNKKGMFWGTNGTGSGVKTFGMENFWGNQWRRTAGLVLINGVQKYKMTWGTQDGSTSEGYNTDGNGYKTVADGTPNGTSGGHMNVMKWNEDGCFGKTASGSETTHYCDGLWFNNSGNMYAILGGSCNYGFHVGAFTWDLADAVSIAGWDCGAALSYHG